MLAQKRKRETEKDGDATAAAAARPVRKTRRSSSPRAASLVPQEKKISKKI
jgi:hypothetical protein